MFSIYLAFLSFPFLSFPFLSFGPFPSLIKPESGCVVFGIDNFYCRKGVLPQGFHARGPSVYAPHKGSGSARRERPKWFAPWPRHRSIMYTSTLSRRPTRFQLRERTISPRLKVVGLMTRSSNSYRQVEQFQTKGSTRKGTIWCNKGSANYTVKISNASPEQPSSQYPSGHV